jgi:DNA-binding transcriptional ArsR family regulator
MNGEQQQAAARRRRTRAEVRQLVSEFVSSGMPRSEFCRSRGLSYSTLDRHLKKRRWKRKAAKNAAPDAKFVAVELALRKPRTEQQPSCGLTLVLPDGRRIEVQRDFDVHTFERLLNALEQV